MLVNILTISMKCASNLINCMSLGTNFNVRLIYNVAFLLCFKNGIVN